jgi:hypothetical protein
MRSRMSLRKPQPPREFNAKVIDTRSAHSAI